MESVQMQVFPSISRMYVIVTTLMCVVPLERMEVEVRSSRSTEANLEEEDINSKANRDRQVDIWYQGGWDLLSLDVLKNWIKNYVSPRSEHIWNNR